MQRMRRGTSKPKRISVALTVEEVLALREVAAASDRSLSWVAAYAIRLYLEATKEPGGTSPSTPSPRDPAR